MPTANEKALRLIHAELKAIRAESLATRKTLGAMSATLTSLGQHVRGMQVALGERERDFQEKHDELGQRIQTTHERVALLTRRIERVERTIKL